MLAVRTLIQIHALLVNQDFIYIKADAVIFNVTLAQATLVWTVLVVSPPMFYDLAHAATNLVSLAQVSLEHNVFPVTALSNCL